MAGQRMLPRPFFCGLLLLVLQRFRGDLGIELHALDDQRLVFRVAIDQPLDCTDVVEDVFQVIHLELLQRLAAIDFRLQFECARQALFVEALEQRLDHDWGTGPSVGGRATLLFCAWLAWSRLRVVIPVWDRKMATTISCLDRSMRVFGGVPTYWLTDNERTVTTGHVAGIAVRHPEMVAFGGHYGVTVETCVPADPESKGGVEATVRVAKADLVPTDANLRGDYESWGELVEACDAFMVEVNNREHRVTRRAPAVMLVEEQVRLHRLPERPYTTVFGETRRVGWSATFSYGGVTYSVPHTLADETVWVRVDGDEIVAVHCGPAGPVEVARHRRSTPGNPVIDNAHYPARPDGPGRVPKPSNRAEEAFLALGDGARLWLVEAASAGTSRVKVKMADAVELAALHGTERVDWALGHAASFGRFADGDLASILAANPPGQRRSAGDVHSLQTGTSAWEGFGR